MSAQSASPGSSPDPRAATGGDPRRWLILAIICVAYLMITLDTSVMNLALPSAQHSLGFTNADRQWIVTAYSLGFGSLLLFCGRLADLLGRKVTFLAGLTGFAVASAIGGASVNFTMLVTARASQGIFAALLAPSALSLITTIYTDPDERNKAFGVLSSVAASGAGLGLLIGGAITSYLSWRWCLYVNLAFAGVAFSGAVPLLGRQQKTPGARLDVPGVVTVSGAIFCLVYGFANAANHSWHTPSTWAFLAAGVALLACFALLETRVGYPLLPPRVVLDRNRGGAYLTMLVLGVGIYGILLFLVYYTQGTLGYSPVVSGVALLPMVAVTAVGANIGNVKLLPRLGPRPLIVSGMLLIGAAMAWLTRIGIHSGYAAAVLGPLIVAGLGIGLIYGASANTGTFGVAAQDSGVASATLNAGQQLGGAMGTALLNTIAANATAAYLISHPRAPQLLHSALVHGYSTVFWWCTAIFGAGAVITAGLLRRGPLAPPRPAPSAAPDQPAAVARSQS